MRDEKKRILILDVPHGALHGLRSLLNRSTLEVYWLPAVVTAVSLARATRFDLLLVGYPVRDSSLEVLVSGVRDGRSPSSQPQFLIFAEDRYLKELEPHRDESLFAISTSQERSELEKVVLKHVREPKRAAARLMVRLEAKLGIEKTLRLCQTENLSQSGVLVKAQRLLPIGSTARIEITLDPDEPPITALVEVARHTEPDVESVCGMGLRFVNFSEGGEEQLHRYLARPGLWV